MGIFAKHFGQGPFGAPYIHENEGKDQVTTFRCPAPPRTDQKCYCLSE